MKAGRQAMEFDFLASRDLPDDVSSNRGSSRPRKRDRIRFALLSTIGQDRKPRRSSIIETVDERAAFGSQPKGNFG